MMGGDRRHIELAYALQFSMPGTPVLRYGEELGMGENLALDGRDAIRTPMQWQAGRTAGFSTAPPDRLVKPTPTRGRFSAARVNARDQSRDAGSLLRWFEQLIRVLRECPEIGNGTPAVVDVPAPRSVLVHRFDAPEGSIVFLHNLADRPARLSLPAQPDEDGQPVEVFSDREYPDLDLRDLQLDGYGYRWIRLRRSHDRT
jgi:maltose alpha-D-glucosyltransferase/alpha-amylase